MIGCVGEQKRRLSDGTALLQDTHRNGEEYDRDRIMDFSDLFTRSSDHSNCSCSSISGVRRYGSDRG